ncbi:MAG: UDP-2,3-diacylglucosamine diphosphatase LpxI [Proteobacteria bacterium]|nr:UDP-2,3-diacylglucosamine diphosphatase LpxI [Pseudomonadota bacterium]
MFPKLGLIAGGGDLPLQVIEQCLKIGRPIFGIGFEGQTASDLFQGKIPHFWCRLGALGKMLQALRSENVQEVVLIGSIQRPSFKELRPDFYTAKLMTRLGMKALGDDALLSFLVQELENEGFSVKRIEEILPAENILLPRGPLGKNTIPSFLLEDMALGIKVARLLGSADVGQSVIIDQGLVLGVEAIEGTDALIKRCGDLKKERFERGMPSGLLVKLCKPQQDEKVDLPTLGLKTLENLRAQGFLGVVAEASKTLLIHQKVCQEFADKAGLFVFGWEEEK